MNALVQPQVSIINNVVKTTSIAVAGFFKKLHKNVLKAIDSLKADLDPAFYALNFELIQNQVDLGMGRTRLDRAYEMTKDGFTLLALGFTGKEALAFKVAYIQRFNDMEATLKGQRPYQMPLPTMSDKRTRVPLKDAVTLLVAKSRNMNYSEAYGMIHQRFDVDSVENLTTEQVPLAVEYIHRVVCEFIGKDALPAPKPLLVINYPAITARPPRSWSGNQHWYKAEDFADGNFDPVRDFLDKLEAEGYEVTGLKIINKAKTWIISQQHRAINHILIGQKQVAEGLRIATDYGMNVSGFTFGKASM